jgi:hypothetical protein
MPRISRQIASLLTELVAQVRKFFLFEQEFFTRFDLLFTLKGRVGARPTHLVANC